MPNLKRSKFKATLLVILAAALCVGQSASEYESADVINVAKRLNCNCGCHLTMSCVMPPTGVCPVCKQNKIRIASMLASGQSQQQIVDTFVKEQGAQVVVVEPGTFGFTGPYIALAIGLAGVLFAIKKLKGSKPAPAAASGDGPANEPDLARYQDQIEKDLEKLD